VISMTALEQAHVSLRESHRAVVMKEAARLCEESLTTDPHQPDILHLLGLLALRRGQYEFASLCWYRALTLDPNQPEVLADLGDLLSRRGRHPEAERLLRRATNTAPRDPALLVRLSQALARHGRLDEAAALYQDVLLFEPNRARTYLELGDVRRQQGRLAEAVDLYRRSVQLDPQDADVYSRLAGIHLQQQEVHQALEILRDGLQHLPGCADLHAIVGEVLMQQGALEDAVASFHSVLLVDPRHLGACRQLVCALERLGDADWLASAWCCLGVALDTQDRLMEAAVAYREAIARKPDSLRALVGLGSVSMRLGQTKQALRQFETVVTIEPEHAEAHRAIGHACHLLGDLERGWKELGWFHRNNGEKPRYFDKPVWDGSPLDGRAILLWTDDDLDEAIQMLRFADLVKSTGAVVIVECQRSVASFVARMPCVDRVIVRRTPRPCFHVHAPLASLPEILITRLDTIPNRTPYLSVDPSLVEMWRQRLGDSSERKIGLAWAESSPGGDARLRSAPLTAFTALGELENIRLVSLQLGAPRRELFAPPPGLRLERLLDESAEPCDMAALMLNLDLVITMDTWVAHLAGALSTPVWTLLPSSPRWPWLLDGDQSPWYPTMRLFRQKRRGEWGEPVERVRRVLQADLAGIVPAHPERQAEASF
jgi:tetratricopeptide (TPR) repeat protein